MGLVGGKSGFSSARDYALFAIGAFIDLFHLITTPPADLAIEILVLGAGLMGAPYVLKKDESSKGSK